MKGKNKLVPRLLGITKKSIVRVDENTKEVSAFVLYFLCTNYILSFIFVTYDDLHCCVLSAVTMKMMTTMMRS